MKTCTSCQQQNADTEDFCLGCGSELPAASASATPTPGPALVATPQPQPAKVAARTLIIGDQSWPLYEGIPVRVARSDSDQNPDIKLNSDKVSATPLILTVIGGKLQVKYDGTEDKDYSVVKSLKPGQPMEVEAGEMVMFGGPVGIIT